MLFLFKQKTAYEMRISDWRSDVCSSDLRAQPRLLLQVLEGEFADFEGNGQDLAVALAAEGEDLAGDLPDVGPAPLDDVGGSREAGAVGVEILEVHGPQGSAAGGRDKRRAPGRSRLPPSSRQSCGIDAVVRGNRTAVMQIGRASGRERRCQDV